VALTAFSSSNARSIATINYVDGLASIPDHWRRVADFRTDQSGALRMTSMASLGEVASWDGSADLSATASAAGASGTKDIAIAQYGSMVTVGRLDAEIIPNLVADMARRMGIAVANTYAKQVYTTLEGGLVGGTVTTGLPTPKTLFATDHTVPGTPSGGPTTRSNYITSALDAAGVAAAVKSARAWVDSTGAPYDLVAGGFTLVVPPDLEEAAMAAVGSTYTLTSVTTTVGSASDTSSAASPSQGLNNMVGQYMGLADIVVAPWLTDTNAWYLLPKLENCLVAWQRLPPVLRITEDADTLARKLVVDFALAVDAKPEPIGIAGNPS